MHAEFRVVDLFAGAGGLSQGFRSGGPFRPIAAVEFDLAAAATYAANHPEVDLFHGDIQDWLTGPVPSAEVVLGGPPCQGFSALGTRDPYDPRNALWRQYVAALERIRPLYFVLENVGEFLRSAHYRALIHETKRSGRLAGYEIEPFLVNAAHVGVPQFRRRAILVGRRRDLPVVGNPGEAPDLRGPVRTVREAIGDLPVPVATALPDRWDEFEKHRVRGRFTTLELHLGRNATTMSKERYRAIPPGGNRFDLPDHLQAPCWRRHTSGSGDVMGRLHWDRPAVTIRTEFWKPEKGRYLHPVAHRPITLLEGARLQSFPDEYLWCGSKSEIGRQIGNAVPVRLAQAVAARIYRAAAA